MRIAVISDIHGNLVALEAVVRAIEALQPDAIWCLGDVVGYGPEPQACIDLVRARADICLCGNHDLAVLDKIDLKDFNDDAMFAARWQRPRLSAEAKSWLTTRPSRELVDGVTLAHASPRHPVWEYVISASIAADNANAFETQFCLIGHSHLAIAWKLENWGRWTRARALLASSDETLSLDDDRWLLNPGSVGQPRDHDPRSSFALLDTAAMTWSWHRCEYDIDAVMAAIVAAGLPAWLGKRLYIGH